MTEYVYNDANGTLASVKHGEGRTLFKLITADEFRAMKESFPHHKEMLRSLGSVRYCKAEAYRDHIWGTLRIPNKNEAPNHTECIRCGMCIRACPTNAVSFRYGFGDGKKEPVKPADKLKTEETK